MYLIGKGTVTDDDAVSAHVSGSKFSIQQVGEDDNAATVHGSDILCTPSLVASKYSLSLLRFLVMHVAMLTPDGVVSCFTDHK